MLCSYACIDLCDVFNNRGELLLLLRPALDPKFRLIYWLGFGVIFLFAICDLPELKKSN